MEAPWSATILSNKPEECSSSSEREARSIALEKAYVHDVYSQIASHFSDSRYRAWPKVKQFLLELEPGSIVCDVGCGNGKYMDINPTIYKIGVDRCSQLSNAAKEKNHEVLISDNLNIPFRDECFDAVISIAVIHHFATTERRVAALKELARVLRIGGKLMVSVWAMEQRHRKFESQDVLVPWSRPMHSSSDDKTSSIERDLNSTTTTTSDDDAATHYHAYTQTSDSDHSFPPFRLGGRKRGRIRHHRGRSIDPTCPSSSQSSSDLSSPNESCYSFVRRALQKLAGSRRHRRRPWFLQGLDIPVDEGGDHFGSLEEDAVVDGLDFRNGLATQKVDSFMPIELRHLESSEFAELFHMNKDKGNTTNPNSGMLLSQLLNSRRRRTLDTASEIVHRSESLVAQPKSKSLSDLLTLFPVSILRNQRKSTEELKARKEAVSTSSLISTFPCSTDEPQTQFPGCMRHKAVQTEDECGEEDDEDEDESCMFPSSLVMPSTSSSAPSNQHSLDTSLPSLPSGTGVARKPRPTLVKQKQSICSVSPGTVVSTLSMEDPYPHGPIDTNGKQPSESDGEIQTGPSNCWGEMKKSVRDLPQLNTLQVPPRGPSGSSFWKQSSLNEDLIFSDRLKEKELLKQNIQKQCSLNEELICERRESTRWDQMKEAFLNSPNVKCLQLLKDGISNRFRAASSTDSLIQGSRGSQHKGNGGNDEQNMGGENPDGGDGESSHHSSSSSTSSSWGINGAETSQQNKQSSTYSPSPTSGAASIRNGIVRMLQTWKGEQAEMRSTSPSYGGSVMRRGSKEGGGVTQRRGLFPPFFLRRSSVGSLTVNRPEHSAKVLSPPHMRRPSDNELPEGGGNGNKLIPGVRHIRKLSREEGSDSSKDSSFQSDTSVDSEDSFASVIFIPSKGMDGADAVFTFGNETRANSTDSDRSPKSPVARLSPPINMPKSPSPLASELLSRRRSPEVSPTKLGYFGAKEVTKFVFDEHATSRLLSPGPAGGVSGSPVSFDFRSQEDTQIEDLSIGVPQRIISPRSPRIPERYIPKEHIAPAQKEELPSVEKVEVPPETEKNQEESDVKGGDQWKVGSDIVQPVIPRRRRLSNPDRIDVVRKPGISVEGSKVTSKLVRRSFPKSLAVELYNPETDDADTSDTSSSSSPDSVSSVVSVSESQPQPHPTLPSEHLIKHTDSPLTPAIMSDVLSSIQEESSPPPTSKVEETPPSATTTTPAVESNNNSDTSPKSIRKLSYAKLSTSEWLSSIPPCDIPLVKRSSLERLRGESKPMYGEIKKVKQGPDAKWPSSMTDESPSGGDAFPTTLPDPTSLSSEQLNAKLLEEMEEADSLFDSLENLSTTRQHPSRNPSIDSSARFSSTTSCSIRGESFESWSSAKSANSSHKASLPSIPQQHPNPLPLPPLPLGGRGPLGNAARMMRYQGTSSSKSSSACGEDEPSTALTYHRYYHVFREGELDKLIEKYVQNLHIINSYYDHANWCIIAEKVQVWTI